MPNHGEPLGDENLLHATMDVFRELLRQGKDARSKGMDVEAAGNAILPGLDVLKLGITRGDPALDQAFRVQLVQWYLHRVYDELNGPMSDAIAPIPK